MYIHIWICELINANNGFLNVPFSDSQNTFNDEFSNNFGNYTKITSIPLNLNPTSDNFNVQQNVQKWITDGLNRVADSSSDPTCVLQQVTAVLTQTSANVNAIVKDIGSLRNASSVFRLIDDYIVNITDTILSMVPPSNQCTNALLRLTCSKCQQIIPKLCRNVCGAAAKGCFAPYVAALNPQFNILWNVTTQLVQFLNATLTDMFTQQNAIKQALVREVVCITCSERSRNNNTYSSLSTWINFCFRFLLC